MQGVFVTGTSTDVGKTHVGVLICQELTNRGISVVPRKPVESGCQRSGNELIPADATALRQASGSTENLDQICRYRFEHAISPVRAALLAHRELNIEQLVNACLEGSENGFLLTEGAGGFYSPLTNNGLNADLATALQLPVILVADDKLGAINQVLLSVQAITSCGLNLVAVVLNQINENKDMDMDNTADLRELLDYPVFFQEHCGDGTGSAAKGLVDCILEHNNMRSQTTAALERRRA